MRADCLNRRAFLAAPLALAACQGAVPADAAPSPAPPLRSIASFPVGVCAMTGQFDDTAWVGLATRHFSQITPEWEMKMEAILGPDRRYDFTRPDRIAAFAAEQGLRLHGHALVWYSQGAEAFAGLDRARFASEYDRYIAAVAGRYRGRVTSWDVVNEAVAEDGNGLRDCHWSAALGQDGYILRAFEQARAADPEAVLFLNDYNLENSPAKGATFLRLVERLLKAGAPWEASGPSRIWTSRSRPAGSRPSCATRPVSTCRSMCRSSTPRNAATAAGSTPGLRARDRTSNWPA